MVDHVAVLVLGDVGRSPRMQYHALSLSELSEEERHAKRVRRCSWLHPLCVYV